ncbi:T9SS type A sorting domain-containing protein [bacterium]|nr:T9SS type A sorting domain-containing protein [bacterium]MBU1072192.1 T9SS type A sorting domain-containing protein [bacterium]MBU1676442.1 T9SS type A sorting domain-containing protein [bacterium]
MRRLILAALVTTLVVATAAQAVPITFKVRMALQVQLGNFDPAQDFVDIAGTFNGWGSDPLTPLADADGDSIYEVTLDGFTPSEFIEFKFRYNGQWDGTEEFPGYGSNRVYTVLESDNLIDVWYNDFAPGDGQVEIGELHWWNDAVFYEILVRSFHDSDGDGIGDLPGLTQKLDYLNDGDPATDDDLGVTGLWLMPINDSPSYHGYDAIDYRAINPDYGTMADFEAFLAAAHARGIKVIIDYVMNHCSDQHPWFVASRQNDPAYRDFFRWSPSDPGETGPWGQNVWHWNSSGWYYGLFWSGMPDLNYDAPAVKDAMFETATYWLDTIGVDGFRLDAVLYIDEDPGRLQSTQGTLQFWQEYNAHVKSVEPDVLSVGEAWTASTTVIQYVIDDRLDLCFEFDLSYATLGAVNDADAGNLKGKASQVYSLYPYLQYATFLTNHDQDRSLNVLGHDLGKAKAAAGLYLTLPGVPFVYYGEEIGMVGSDAHEYIRSPMQWTDGPDSGFTTGTPWQAINGNYEQYNVLVEESDSGSLLNWYKQLIRVRNQSSALRHGTYQPLTSSASPVLAFVRSDELQTVLCLANTSDIAQGGVTLTGTETSLVPGDHEIVDLLDPADTRTITITPGFEISNLSLAGHEVRAYEFEIVTGADPGLGDLPETGLRLDQNHPNPFNPSTTIRYALPARSHIRIGVYDVTGREVAVLQDGVQGEGGQEVHWDGADRKGQALGAGMYFVRLEAGDEIRFTKMMMVR